SRSAGASPQKPAAKPAKQAVKATKPAASGATSAKPADQKAATSLLRRALELGQSKNDVDWVASSAVKTQMLRMDPTFQEKLLGYKTFTDFLKSRGNVIEVKEEGQLRSARLRGTRDAES